MSLVKRFRSKPKLSKRQALFNIICNHLLTQNQRSVDACGRATTYGENGNKDVIGYLFGESGRGIMDGYIPPITKSFLMADRAFWNWIKINGLKRKHAELIRQCCLVHDNVLPSNWRNALISVGQFYKLETSFLEMK